MDHRANDRDAPRREKLYRSVIAVVGSAAIIVLPVGCTQSDAPAPESISHTQQPWYSWEGLGDTFAQHRVLMEECIPAANSYAASKGLGDHFFDSEKMVDANEWTDDTGSHEDWFTYWFGARRDSQNHSFLRDEPQSAYEGCTAALADMKAVTESGLYSGKVMNDMGAAPLERGSRHLILRKFGFPARGSGSGLGARAAA